MSETALRAEKFVEIGGGITLCYDTFGNEADPALVLVMGLGTQMIAWHEDFCERIAERGFHVVRFDNRDTGHSTSIRSLRPPRLDQLATRRFDRRQYTIADMADDTAGMLRELDLAPAHVVGASMGGMIAQVAGYRHPQRVRSLGLIMTGSGKRIASLPRLRALGTLLAKPARTREGFIKVVTNTFGVIGSPDYPMDADREAEFRELLGQSWDRGHRPAGVARQLHAITSSRDRTRKLAAVRAPTVVIHGEKDPLVRPVAGRSLARAIPGAQLRIVPGMGHDLPPALYEEIAEVIAANAARPAPASEAAPARDLRTSPARA
jgi:pimeloyl-ACP methyl ester carboxylesterase